MDEPLREKPRGLEGVDLALRLFWCARAMGGLGEAECLS